MWWRLDVRSGCWRANIRSPSPGRSLAREVDTGFVSRWVTRVLDKVIGQRGLPQVIRCDNGPELTSRHFLAWGLEWKIELRHIQPYARCGAQKRGPQRAAWARLQWLE